MGSNNFETVAYPGPRVGITKSAVGVRVATTYD